MDRPLFAYGTLRDAELLAAVLGRAVAPETLVPAVAPAHRVVFYPGRVYPAIIAAPGNAEGTLVHGLSAADLAVLDLFEGNEYVRRPIAVTAEGRSEPAEVYWPTCEIAPSAKDWQFADWARNHRAKMLVSDGAAAAELRARLIAQSPAER
jgi:hypothetical protein